ncbi:hypothetical protein KDK_13710 [Dictyobacter kobayashii]|uniref:DNA primase n=1 Tax=Dictyobacter kobayashii TaxID=2014872 RepID=A0A402AEQ0_9CHLR|nr:hypothetical protein KDK_13710 [Dictyobacter kobayashii]
MLSRREAMEELGLLDVSFEAEKLLVVGMDAKEFPPHAKWQESGWLMVEYAEKALWETVDGWAMLAYLRGRGLKDEIIRRKRFGYVPLGKDGRWYLGRFEDWGLDPEQLLPAQREKQGVRIPPGILMPWYEGDLLWRLALKRPQMPKGQDYGQVVGSGEGMFNIDQVQCGQPVMMVEAELCACSVEQEAGDLVACVATGSTTRGRLGRWIADLALTSVVLQAFDEDPGGDEGADYWLRTLKQSIRWSPLIAKDPNELLQRQNDPGALCTLRQWVEGGLVSGAPAGFGAIAPPEVVELTGGAAESPEGEEAVELTGGAAESPEGEEAVTASRQEREVELYLFADTVARIVDVLGGPEKVRVARQEPLTHTVDRFYQPVTLPELPRTHCPHIVLQNRRVSERCSRPVARPCPGIPLECGWCEEHLASHEVLCLLAQLGYPRLELGSRGIEAGVANAEWYACLSSADHTKEDIARIRVRFDGALQAMATGMPPPGNTGHSLP